MQDEDEEEKMQRKRSKTGLKSSREVCFSRFERKLLFRGRFFF